MFDFVWNLNENEFENFKEKQRTYKESNYDGGWIGNVRCGLLCFDIIDFDTFLHFDLYVGGVDTGYGYVIVLKINQIIHMTSVVLIHYILRIRLQM